MLCMRVAAGGVVECQLWTEGRRVERVAVCMRGHMMAFTPAFWVEMGISSL